MLCGCSQVSGSGVPSIDGFAISLLGVSWLCKLPFLPSTWRWTRREKCILENQWRPGKQHTQASCGIRESQGEDDLWEHEVLGFNNNLSWPRLESQGKDAGHEYFSHMNPYTGTRGKVSQVGEACRLTEVPPCKSQNLSSLPKGRTFYYVWLGGFIWGSESAITNHLYGIFSSS